MRKLRIAFVVEQILGHRTHYKNLQHYVASDSEIEPVWIPIEPFAHDLWQKLPMVRNNWTLLSSLRARSGLKRAMRDGPLDLIFFHTQVMMLAAGSMMKRIPTVASLDATPIGMDTLDGGYGEHHRVMKIERVKNAANKRALGRCRKVVAWSDWAAGSLIQEYGVDPAKVMTLPPGIDLASWEMTRVETKASDKPVKLLFVGGQFHRKGGDLLLDVFRRRLTDRCEIDIVTGPDLTGAESVPGVRIHRGLQPNTDALRDLYRQADVFVLPTRGDCMPFVILEAAAAGLPVVTTKMGAIPEMVEDGVSGFVIPPANLQMFEQRLMELVDDPMLRLRMGRAAREFTCRKFDGQRNYRTLLEVLKNCA